MIFCISNIAWNENETKDVLKLLKEKRIRYLEYSPNLLLNNNFSRKKIRNVKKYWNDKKIRLYSMQSILYKKKNAYLFGEKYQRKIFFKEVEKKIKIAKSLGSKVIVFGSPASRKIFNYKKNKLDELSYDMFSKIASLCMKYKVYFCLEANPKIYKTKYLTHTNDSINLVKKINNRYFKINLDLGTIIANKENFKLIIKNNLKFIGHVQISSPYLKNLLYYKKKIDVFVKTLQNLGYKKVISFEMLKNNKNNLKVIKKVLEHKIND